MKVSLNEALKVVIPYNHSSGDRVTPTDKFIADKAKLDADTKRDLHKLIRGWQGSGGKWPIFEPKRRILYNVKNPKYNPDDKNNNNKFISKKLLLYVIQLKHREPPIHITVFLDKTDPLYKTTPKKPNPIGKLFIFDRIIVGYDEYTHYINSVLKSA